MTQIGEEVLELTAALAAYGCLANIRLIYSFAQNSRGIPLPPFFCRSVRQRWQCLSMLLGKRMLAEEWETGPMSHLTFKEQH